MNTQIHQTKFLGGALLVTASVTHLSPNEVTPERLASSLQNVAKNALYALAGSFNIVDQGPRRTVVQGYMIPAKTSVPFNKNTQGFHALSSSLYQDSADTLWNLQRTDHGEYLVRANTIEDPAELLELMKACCSSIPRGSDNAFFQAVASSEQSRDEVQDSDYVQYQHNGEIRFGFALASVEDESIDEALAVVNCQTDTLDIIDRDQIVGSAAFGYAVDGETLNLDDSLASVSNSTDTNTMIEYYRKVYSFNETYWSKLENIIANHRFM